MGTNPPIPNPQSSLAAERGRWLRTMDGGRDLPQGERSDQDQAQPVSSQSPVAQPQAGPNRAGPISARGVAPRLLASPFALPFPIFRARFVLRNTQRRQGGFRRLAEGTSGKVWIRQARQTRQLQPTAR